METQFSGSIAPSTDPFAVAPDDQQIQVIKDAFAATNLRDVMTIDDTGTVAFKPNEGIIESSYATTGTGLAEELAYIAQEAWSADVEMVSTPLMQMSDDTGLCMLRVYGGGVFLDTIRFGNNREVISYARDVFIG